MFVYGPAGAVGGIVELCRYLGARFRAVAEQLGLETGRDSPFEWSSTALAPATSGKPTSRIDRNGPSAFSGLSASFKGLPASEAGCP